MEISIFLEILRVWVLDPVFTLALGPVASPCRYIPRMVPSPLPAVMATFEIQFVTISENAPRIYIYIYISSNT